MNAATVIIGVDVVGHCAHLQIPANLRIVVRCPRVLHRAQRPGIDTWHKQPFTNQPISLSSGLAERALFGHRGKDVADAFIQRARLILIGQSDGELRDAVRELVCHDVHRLGEALKDLAIAVAENELGPVPKRVVIVPPVMDRN